MWAWGRVDEREAGEVTHKQVLKGPGNRLLPRVKVGFQQVFWGFQKLPAAAAAWLWLTEILSVHPRSHEDGTPAGQPGLHGQPAQGPY